MALPQFGAEESGIIGHLLAGGEMVPAQQASPSTWSPEKKLAAAVLTAALTEIRDHHLDRSYRRRVAEDVAWVSSNDSEWPYSFIPLCELFGLETEYVRGVVRRWLQRTEPCARPVLTTVHRNAA